MEDQSWNRRKFFPTLDAFQAQTVNTFVMSCEHLIRTKTFGAVTADKGLGIRIDIFLTFIEPKL